MQEGDIIAGVGGESATTLIEFYRKIHARGDAGVEVPIDIRQGPRTRTLNIRSAERNNYYRKASTL